jgi:predicted ATPase
VAREVSSLATSRGIEPFWTFCESHTSKVPFQVVARLLRASTGVAELDGQAARAKMREQLADADPQDLLLLDDLLGIADTEVPLPQIDPEARRRRLTSLINTAQLARTTPAIFIIEDAHWIDEVSDSLIADMLTIIPQTPSLVLVTHRPDYEGALSWVHGAQTVALAPLSDSQAATLIGELLGPDPTVGALGESIIGRAAGNPFFAEEIVRDLAERGVLHGQTGEYKSTAEAAEVTVPATVQATIAARIDRLDPKAKRTLSAASVVGSNFGVDLVTALGIEPSLDDLVKAELIDQIRFTPCAQYAFRHPLVRAVAYESQL